MRAISFFLAISQLAGGGAAPKVFAALIGSGTRRDPLTIGYFVGAGIMIAGGLIVRFYGVNAERQPLEDIAMLLSVVSSSLSQTRAASV